MAPWVCLLHDAKRFEGGILYRGGNQSSHGAINEELIEEKRYDAVDGGGQMFPGQRIGDGKRRSKI